MTSKQIEDSCPRWRARGGGFSSRPRSDPENNRPPRAHSFHRTKAAQAEQRDHFLREYRQYAIDQYRKASSASSATPAHTLPEDLEELVWTSAFHSHVTELRRQLGAASTQVSRDELSKEARGFLTRGEGFFRSLIWEVQEAVGTLRVTLAEIPGLCPEARGPPRGHAARDVATRAVARFLVYLGDLHRYAAELPAPTPGAGRAKLQGAWGCYVAAAGLRPSEGRASMQAASLLCQQRDASHHMLGTWHLIRAVAAEGWGGRSTAVRNFGVLASLVISTGPAVREAAQEIASVTTQDTPSLLCPAGSKSSSATPPTGSGASPLQGSLDPLQLGSRFGEAAPASGMGESPGLDAAFAGVVAVLWGRLPVTVAWVLVHRALTRARGALCLPVDKCVLGGRELVRVDLAEGSGSGGQDPRGGGRGKDQGNQEDGSRSLDLSAGLLPYAAAAIFAHWDVVGGVDRAGTGLTVSGGGSVADSIAAARSAGNHGDNATRSSVAACLVVNLAAALASTIAERSRGAMGHPYMPALHMLLRYIVRAGDDMTPLSKGEAPDWYVGGSTDETARRYLLDAWGSLTASLSKLVAPGVFSPAPMSPLALARLLSGERAKGRGDRCDCEQAWAESSEGVCLRNFAPLGGVGGPRVPSPEVTWAGDGIEGRVSRMKSVLSMSVSLGRALVSALRLFQGVPQAAGPETGREGVGARLQVAVSSCWTKLEALDRALHSSGNCKRGPRVIGEGDADPFPLASVSRGDQEEVAVAECATSPALPTSPCAVLGHGVAPAVAATGVAPSPPRMNTGSVLFGAGFGQLPPWAPVGAGLTGAAGGEGELETANGSLQATLPSPQGVGLGGEADVEMTEDRGYGWEGAGTEVATNTAPGVGAALPFSTLASESRRRMGDAMAGRSPWD